MIYYSSPLAGKFQCEHCLDSEQTNEITPGPRHNYERYLLTNKTVLLHKYGTISLFKIKSFD